MSSDYKNSKANPASAYPMEASKVHGEGAAGFTRVEHWLTPERLRNEFLFGIPLTSPITGQVMTDPILKDIIRRMAARMELECKVDVTPVQRVIRKDFDRTKYSQGWNQIDVGFSNIQSVEEVSIRAVDSHIYPDNPIVSISRLSNVVTVVTQNLHHLLVGHGVQISGVQDSTFDGSFPVVTTPTSSSFTFNQTGPDISSSNGLVL